MLKNSDNKQFITIFFVGIRIALNNTTKIKNKKELIQWKN